MAKVKKKSPAQAVHIHVEMVRSVARLTELLQELDGFLQKAGVCSFYQDPRILILLSQDGSRRIQLRVGVARCNGQIVAVAPCYVEIMRFRLRLSLINLPSPAVRLLKVAGGSFVFERSIEPSAYVDALFTGLMREQQDFDMLQFDNMLASSDMWKICRERYVEQRRVYRLVVLSSGSDKTFCLELPASYEDWLASLKGKARRTLLRGVARSKRNLLRATRITKSDGVKEFLSQVDRIFQKSWQHGTLDSSRRDTPNDILFMREVARLGWLRSYVLWRKSQPIGFVIGYQYRDVFYYSDTGYDLGFASVGPGEILSHMIMEDLFGSRTPKKLDMGSGDNVYKRKIGCSHSDAFTAYLVRPGRWLGLLFVQMTLDRIDKFSRIILVRLKLDKKIRNIMRRKKAKREGGLA